jgi:hypothetical protein
MHLPNVPGALGIRFDRTFSWLLMLCSASTLGGCAIYDPIPSERARPGTSEGSQSASWVPTADEREFVDAGNRRSRRDAGQPPRAASDNDDAGSPDTAPDSDREDAAAARGVDGAAADEPVDSGTPSEPGERDGDAPTQPDAATDAGTIAAEGCTRESLLERAERFLTALGNANPYDLNLHPNVRFTENGQQRTIGLGIWLEAARPEFARHVVDDSNCSSATEAVLRTLSGRIIFGARLRYLGEQLLEIETLVVNSQSIERYFAPDAIIPDGADPWIEPLADADRRPRQELVATAMRYFDSSTVPSLLPPVAEGCERLLNGAPIDQGRCDVPPGSQRYEQARFPVADETTGVTTAIVGYQGYVSMYFIKQRAGALHDIETVGGVQSESIGW